MAVLGLWWGPQWSGMVDMLIPDKFEIGFSKEMICRVIFGVKYQILATKIEMIGNQLFLGCMCGRFGALMGPQMVANGRYANPR